MTRLPSVLVIDDEVANLRVFQRVFRSKFLIVVADGWVQARALLVDAVPDIVFVDLCMPTIGGIEVLRHVQRMYPTVTRYLLTGYGDTPEVIAATESGLCTGVLAKPWERDAVEAIVVAAASR